MTVRRAACGAFFCAVVLIPSLIAQVNPSGPWRTLHTEHFRIHFRPTYRAVAVEAAAEAERAYRLLASELQRPRGTIDLTISDDMDSPNGFAATFPSNRVTILLVPPVADPALRNYDSWLRLVLVHEISHVFHLDRSRGVWKVLQTVFGRAPGLFPNHYQPSWVTEGIATYYESRYTAGGRADGTFHREVVAVDHAAGTARTPWDALFFTRWPNGHAPYAYGSRFWEHVSRSAPGGDSLVPRFVERSAGQLIPFRVGRQLRKAGAPRSLMDEWTRMVRASPAPDAAPTRSRLIAGGLRTEPVPRVARDGRTVAFVHDDGRGVRRLRLIAPPAQGSRSHRVNGQVQYDWLGDTLIVAQLDFSDRWTIRSDLWRWEPGGRWRRATRNARLTAPRGGGGLLAAVALRPGFNVPALDSASRPASPPATAWGAVVPSPDGRWIVATRHQDGHWALVRWPRTAPDSIAVLTEQEGVIADPTWRADGVLFAAEGGESMFPQIYLWTAADGVTQLTDEPFGARAPASYHDGSMLFTTVGRDGWELRAVAPSRRAVQPAVAAQTFERAPPVAARETGYALWPSLRPYFWIPLAYSTGGSGTFFGATTAGSDALGRYTYVIGGTVSSDAPRRAEGFGALFVNTFGNPTLDLSASNDWSFLGIDTTGAAVHEVEREAALGATFVRRRWRSSISLRLAAEYQGTPGVRDLVGGSASLAFGAAVAAPLAVSLQDGVTGSVLYRRREEHGTSRWLSETRGRLVLYARFGPRVGFAYPVLGVRASVGAFNGPIADRFSVGGASSGTPDVTFGQSLGTARSFPVRGYSGATLRGRHAATISAEYRVPLALVGKSLGHLPFGLDKLSFSLFHDRGDAWDPGEEPRLHRLRAYGVELVSDVTVSYDVGLRLRIGVAQPATGRAQGYTALGADF